MSHKTSDVNAMGEWVIDPMNSIHSFTHSPIHRT
jgi:hypothetical protein